jgi:hypothetical protein
MYKNGNVVFLIVRLFYFGQFDIVLISQISSSEHQIKAPIKAIEEDECNGEKDT